jgi:hypothetical protein
MAFVDDKPLDMVDALIRDYVLPRALFAGTEKLLGHESC